MLSLSARACALLVAPLAVATAFQPGSNSQPGVRGSFVVQAEPVTKTELQPTAELVRSTFAPIFEQVATLLSATFKFEGTVPIIFRECGEVTAYWLTYENQLVMCYEIVEEIKGVTARLYQGDSATQTQAFSGAIMFVLYHELGHALVDLLDLPVTGREEDVADQLALVFFGMAPGNVVYAADMFRAFGQGSELKFYDVHALNEQRFYNLICWYYGADPTAYQWVVVNGHLPGDRAESCPGEYQTMQRAWSRLLQPHMVTAPAAPGAHPETAVTAGPALRPQTAAVEPGMPGGNAVTVGAYTLEIPAGVTVNQLQNGGLELDAPGQGKAHIAPIVGDPVPMSDPSFSGGQAAQMLPAVAQRWNEQFPLRVLQPPTASQLEHLDGSGAFLYYEQNLHDQRGPNVVHGILYLQVRRNPYSVRSTPEYQSVVIDVFANGMAAQADWNPLNGFLHQILGKLRAPSAPP